MKRRKLKLCSDYELTKDTSYLLLWVSYGVFFLHSLEKRYHKISRKCQTTQPTVTWNCIQNTAVINVEPLWKGQECLTKVVKFGPFPCAILYKSCLFHPSWQATSFERPPSWVAFTEGFHCTLNSQFIRLLDQDCWVIHLMTYCALFHKNNIYPIYTTEVIEISIYLTFKFIL